MPRRQILKYRMGCAPGSASGHNQGRARTRGLAQNFRNPATARQSLASHQAAKPEWMEPSFRIGSWFSRA